MQGAQRQLGAARDRLESAQALVRDAEANVKKTSDDVVRYKLLVDKNEIPRQQYDTAVAAADFARASLTATCFGAVLADSIDASACGMR